MPVCSDLLRSTVVLLLLSSPSYSDIDPPTDLSCSWPSGLTLSAEWTNGATYDTLFVDVNGVEVAELDGSSTSADVALSEANVYSVVIRAYDEALDCFSSSDPCTVDVGLVSGCDTPADGEVDATIGATDFVLDYGDDVAFEELECFVDFSTDSISDWMIELTNPDGDSITLFDQLGDDVEEGLCAVFSDFGAPNNEATPASTFLACNDKLQPHELSNGATAAMADLAGSSTVGEWTLTLENVLGANDGTLEEWCLRFVEGCPIDAVTDVSCTAFDGNQYPITVSWSNQDPDEDYSEFNIFRNGELIVTITDPDAEEYTDTAGPGGQLVYTVNVYSAGNDCYKTTVETCAVSTGRNDFCASENLDFEVVAMDADVEVTSSIDATDSDLMQALAELDGTNDDDLSPTEDGRVDILDLQVSLTFTTDSVETFTWTVTSPEGTELTLWDLSGGDVGWESDSVLFTDTGEPIPAEAPSDCTVEECQYRAPVGEMSDFQGEDALGVWTLDGLSTLGGSLEDWCVYVFTDEGSVDPDSGLYIRGDVDGSGVVSAIIDALRLLQHYFGDADAPPCFAAADVDGSGAVSAIVDALRLLQHFFGDADEPPAPFPTCGRADPGYEYVGVQTPCETSTVCP